MTGPDGPVGDDQAGEEDQTVPQDQPAPFPRSRRRRRVGGHPEGGRWAAMISVVVVVGVVAVVSAAFPAPSATPAPVGADAVPVPPAGATASSAFCVGGTGTAAATTIYLTNTTTRPVAGVMTSIGQPASTGPAANVQQPVDVPARDTVAVDPSSGLGQASNAASFVFAGGGVVASQVVGGPGGWGTAPCASQAGPLWYFAGGSTTGGNTLTLALLDPTATEAVVDVSFVTPAGLITPQAYQGLVVPAGQLAVENVGQFVQDAPEIATVVTAESGTLVGTEFQQVSGGFGSGVSLRLGAPALATTWRFAQTSTGPGSGVDFTLANPGGSPATATVSFSLSSGTVVPRRVSIPPVSIVDFSASGTAGLPQQVPYSVTVDSSAPIVVGRSVEAASGSPAPQWGSSSGTVTAARRWVVPGPGIVSQPGTAGATVDSLAVANPSGSAATVKVTTLPGDRSVAMFTVAPEGVAVLGAKSVGGLSVFSITSSQPVTIEEDSQPSGAPGVISSTGFPFTH
jgi:hypothetical protein